MSRLVGGVQTHESCCWTEDMVWRKAETKRQVEWVWIMKEIEPKACVWS